jgi:MoaA/NifB/PqqE/SkfB family radical SAM enzyme
MKDIINVTKQNTRVFNTISIGTGSLCNRKCKFCANAYHKRPDEWMSEKTFLKIIDDLKNMKYKGRIELQSFNEPLRDSRIFDFIRHIRLNTECCIMFNTNGDYIESPKTIIKLFECGLNQLEINVYDNVKKLDVFEQYAEKVVNKLSDVVLGGSMYDKISYKKRHLDIVDKTEYLDGGKNISIYDDRPSKVYNMLANNAGFLNGKLKGMKPKNQDKICVLPFRKATINWKGDMILCCNHYTGDVNFGNVRNSSVEELWNSDVANYYRLLLQNKRRIDLEPCCDCNEPVGFYPHMIQKITFGNKKDKELLES